MPRIIITEKVRRRFEKKFRVTPGCWIWTAGTGTYGYGRIGIAGDNMIAPRVSYTMYVGEIPEGLWVLHSCDNRLCVNPDHLRAGTLQDNVDDMMDRGRHVGKAKLTHAQVAAIRLDGRPLSVIAMQYGVTIPNIAAIRNGRSWKRLPGPRVDKHKKQSRPHNRRNWTEQEIDQVRTRYSTEEASAIATSLNRSTAHIYAKAKVLGLKKSKARGAPPALVSQSGAQP
jgi:hypothetical protein